MRPGRIRKANIRASGAGEVLQGCTLTLAVPAPGETWSQATINPQQPQWAQTELGWPLLHSHALAAEAASGRGPLRGTWAKPVPPYKQCYSLSALQFSSDASASAASLKHLVIRKHIPHVQMEV